MNKNLIITGLLMLTVYAFTMEEKEKPINPKCIRIKTYLDKLPVELRDIINQFRIFELEQLPEKLVVSILTKLIQAIEEPGMEGLNNSIDAINELRLISKRYDSIINSTSFIDQLIKYLSKKYGLAPLVIVIKWPISGVHQWLKLQDKNTLTQMLQQMLQLLIHQKLRMLALPPLPEATQTRYAEVMELLLHAGAQVDKDTLDIATQLHDELESVEIPDNVFELMKERATTKEI